MFAAPPFVYNGTTEWNVAKFAQTFLGKGAVKPADEGWEGWGKTWLVVLHFYGWKKMLRKKSRFGFRVISFYFNES